MLPMHIFHCLKQLTSHVEALSATRAATIPMRPVTTTASPPPLAAGGP
jgi:hypothetical protein